MESAPNEKNPESQEPEDPKSPEEFDDLDTSTAPLESEELNLPAIEKPYSTADRLDGLFVIPLDEKDEAFQAMWKQIEKSPMEDGEASDIAELKEYLSKKSLEEYIGEKVINNNNIENDDAKALFTLGKALESTFQKDGSAGGNVISKLGKRIQLVLAVNSLTLKDVQGIDDPGLEAKIEGQLLAEENSGEMTEQFRGYIQDILERPYENKATESTKKEEAANTKKDNSKTTRPLDNNKPKPLPDMAEPPPEKNEKEKRPVTPWKLGVETKSTSETEKRKKNLGILLMPPKSLLENPEQQAVRKKTWDNITNSIFKGEKANPDSVFMRMAERAGGVPRNMKNIDEVLSVLKEGGLAKIKNPAKLSSQEVRELRLAGLLLLQAGYDGKEQKDFNSLTQDQKLIVRTGEIVGMVAEADIIRRMAKSEKGLDETRAKQAHKRYWQYAKSADIPEPFKKYFGQVETMLREEYNLKNSFRQPGEPGYKEPVTKKTPEQLAEEEKDVFFQGVLDWQLAHPGESYKSWTEAQANNPDAIKKFQTLSLELEDGVGAPETPEEIWARLQTQARAAMESEVNINTPQPQEILPTKESATPGIQALDPAEQRLLDRLQNMQQNTEYTDKFPGFIFWSKQADAKTRARFLSAAKKRGVAPGMLWDELKHKGQESPLRAEGIRNEIIEQYLAYQDTGLPSDIKERTLENTKENENAIKYAESLAKMATEKIGGIESVAKSAKLSQEMMLARAKLLDLPVSPYGKSISWAMWDMGKQYFYFTHPDQADSGYTIRHPKDKRDEIVNRHLGWEAYGAFNSPNSAEFKNKILTDARFTRVREFLQKPANKAGTLSSQDLAVLGKTLMDCLKESST